MNDEFNTNNTGDENQINQPYTPSEDINGIDTELIPEIQRDPSHTQPEKADLNEIAVTPEYQLDDLLCSNENLQPVMPAEEVFPYQPPVAEIQPQKNSFNAYGNYSSTFNDESYRKAIKNQSKKGSSRGTVIVLSILLFISFSVLAGIGIIELAKIQPGDIKNTSSIATASETADTTSKTDTTNPQIIVPGETGNELSIAAVAKKVNPAVVSIIVETAGNKGLGTGMIFTEDGYILTNAHVVEGAKTIKIITIDEEEYTAKLVGADSKTDLAVLKIDANNLPTVTFGDSDKMEVGDAVVAIGNPYGLILSNTVTNGIVSAVRKGMMVGEGEMDLIQTNAAINFGNSGGPLLNMKGNVIGVNSLKIVSESFEGLGFAIPINSAIPIIDSLKQYGYVKDRPMLGINGEFLDERKASIQYGCPAGMYIDSVMDGTDAKAKGLRKGDIVIKIDGKSFTSLAEFNVIKERFKAGDTVSFVIWRQGSEFEISITMVESRPAG